MPTGVYVRSPVRSRWKQGQELIDLIEASGILFLSITGIHWQIRKKGALKLQEFSSRRWWVLKSDVLELKTRREKEFKEAAEVSHEHHLKKMKEWHDKMTKEGRCHWCGAPASKVRKYVCRKHLAKARANDRASRERRRERLRRRGLCANCGERPRRSGFETCTICSLRSALRNMERREDKTWERLNALAEGGLITIDEAAEMLRVHRVSVHNFINKGLLKVKVHTFRRFYLDKEDVENLQAERGRGFIIDSEMDMLHQRIMSTQAPRK